MKFRDLQNIYLVQLYLLVMNDTILFHFQWNEPERKRLPMAGFFILGESLSLPKRQVFEEGFQKNHQVAQRAGSEACQGGARAL